MKHILIILTLLFFFSCHNEQKEKDKQIIQLVNEWQGKQIVFPENIVFTRNLTDTTDYQIPQSEYKVLVYVSSTGCISCKLKLNKWKELIRYTDSITNSKVPFLFFFHPKDISDIHNLLKEHNFELPVCIDKEDQLNKLNKLPTDMSFQTFLLDKDNKVTVLGNPIQNLAIKDLYLKKIAGVQEQKLQTTTIKAEKDEYDLGLVQEGTIQKQAVVIKNTGSASFQLKGFTTSCDCTEVVCNWNELQPGESKTITIHYKAEQPGDFYRTVDVYGNTDKTITIRIIGTVIQ